MNSLNGFSGLLKPLVWSFIWWVGSGFDRVLHSTLFVLGLAGQFPPSPVGSPAVVKMERLEEQVLKKKGLESGK